jgi:hypothetical protein
LDQDMRACRSKDAIGALLSNVRRSDRPLRAGPEDFRGALVDKGGLFGMYVACHHRGLRDLFSGGRVILQSAVERHHILPRAQFPDTKKADADCIANIAFVSEGANRSVSNSGPEVYLSKIPREALESQCIPTNRDLWLIDAAEEFWAKRRDLLAQAFNAFLKTHFPTRRI